MSIFKVMVSTERCYKDPSSQLIDRIQSRGEYWYVLRSCDRRPKFLAEPAVQTRLRFLLAIIEARAVVLDASIHSDSSWLSLTVVCVSSLDPGKASAVFRKIVPHAIVEQISAVDPQLLKKHLHSAATPPWMPALDVLENSRDILFTLLLEYRYLLAGNPQTVSDRPAMQNTCARRLNDQSLFFNLLFFERSGVLFSVPEFQVEKIENKNLYTGEQWGGMSIGFDDVLWTSPVSAAELRVLGRTDTAGHCHSSAIIDGRSVDFVLIVPGFL